MITVRDLYKEYPPSEKNGTGFKALKGVSYTIKPGSFFTMLGPSGCGKTTTLRSIAGLEKPTGGEIYLGDQLVYSSNQNVFVPPEKRGIGMVFQSYAIWPHMTVAKNVSYPLENRKIAKQDIDKKVNKALEMVGLGKFKDKLAPNLSGGQQQRVALARAMVSEPEVLLLDEPLSNLDAKLREQMRHELKNIQKQTGLTAVYVTHDQEEALALSDVVVLMLDGEIVEMGHPFDLYQDPKKRFTASFIGVSNFVESKRSGGSSDSVLAENEFGRFQAKDYSDQADQIVDLSFRPHNIQLYRDKPDQELNTGKGRVSDLVFLGETIEFHLVAGEKKIRLRTHPTFLPNEGEEIYFSIDPKHCIVYSPVKKH